MVNTVKVIFTYPSTGQVVERSYYANSPIPYDVRVIKAGKPLKKGK